ncbi:hypothetical protein KCU98_g998, partial [Aureobasidium melanogenum]
MSARPSWHKGILYNNPMRSDVVIICSGHMIYAHKAILMAASGLFYTAFSSNFSVAEVSTYELDGYDLEIVETMIEFIYQFPKCTGLPNGKFEQTLECFALANEYQVPSLCRAITEYVTDFCAMIVKRLKRRSHDYNGVRDDFLDQISALYRDNVIADRSLIESVADMLTNNFCHELIRPEVIELLYVRRTTRSDKPPSDPVSTMFRPVTMSDWSKKDPEEDRNINNVSHVKPWLFGQP